MKELNDSIIPFLRLYFAYNRYLLYGNAHDLIAKSVAIYTPDSAVFNRYLFLNAQNI